eukprot:GABV01000359.1.p1 GENE.GABV01000359.1~~GABV01000359.1.p1  ORF type:complete len:445 (-),score=144.03 GABV01000359.1:79-1413(-)
MRFLVFGVVALLFAQASASFPEVGRLEVHPQLWPYPASVEFVHDEVFEIVPSNFAWHFEVPNQNEEIRELLTKAVDRYKSLIFWDLPRDTVDPYLEGVPYTNFSQHLKLAETTDTAAGERLFAPTQLRSIRLSVTTEALNLDLDTDEAYAISISLDSPEIEMAAPSVFGIIRALETLSQLVERVGDYDEIPRFLTCVTEIRDAPRFPVRGLLVDTSRHYQPMDLLKANLDAMATAKLNLMHWHIVDDQSFPFESRTHPDLIKGAYSPRLKYTINDVKEIILYARERGIRVMPEFDSPGHMRSWGKGYPDLLTKCPGNEAEHEAPINPVRESSYDFMDKMLDEIAQVFSDPWIHNGGDEAWFGRQCWGANQEIRDWMAENGVDSLDELEKIYNVRLANMVVSKIKNPVVWQEAFSTTKDTNKCQKFDCGCLGGGIRQSIRFGCGH